MSHPGSTPSAKADLLLVHPPAFFEFRDRRDMYFPYLSTSGDVPITPLYEYFPIGFKTLRRYLGERGHDVKIVNLASLLLRYPSLDLPAFLRSLEVRVFGIDLHWMVHVQGSLAVAELIKSLHPSSAVLFGGTSSTYFAQELVRYPFIDMVMRGYDTHAPMDALLTRLRSSEDLTGLPNLLWKRAGQVVDNGYTHIPETFACGIDWSTLPRGDAGGVFPILEVLSTQNAGCSNSCGWCGGSREAFERVFKRRPAMSRKSLEEIAYEFQTMAAIPDQRRYHFYSVGAYNETKERLRFFIDRVAESQFKSISYEQFHLTPDDILDAMVKANSRTTITLSPESHDLRVARLAGRGVYTPEQMEQWAERALGRGIYQIDVWYFIGMPEQDEASVYETVDYCERLLRRFKGKRVVPMLCPMIPFLDPASTFFEDPDRHGYHVFHRSVEEHRRGMRRASLINRLNYESRWLSRSALVEVGYAAVRRLVEIKGDLGFLPGSVAQEVVAEISDAERLIETVHEIDCLEDPRERARRLEGIGAEIAARNRRVFFSGVANQAFPIPRGIGGRWFDEMLYSPEQIEAALAEGWSTS